MNKRKVIGAILGIIFYGACVFFFTYAYYNWKSDNTPVGLNITDKSLEVEFETGPEVNSLNIGPVLDYIDGESTTFKVYNPTENPIYINTALDITTISDNLKTEYFKYKLLVDRSGGTNFTELVTEGNFLNLNVGSNNLLLSFLVPVDSIYNYKFIVYIDGNIYNNNNIQENILESNLVVTEGSKVLLTFDPNGGNDGITEKEVYMGQTYGDLPTPTRTGYTFDGWYTAETGGTKITSDTIVTVTEEQILYAKWLVLGSTYVINKYNDGSTITTVNIGRNSSKPQVNLNATQGIMLDNNGEYRYYGADPNNYVSYNDELWRIISVGNVKSSATDTTGETRVKIVKADILTDDNGLNAYSWDSSASSVNSGSGVNDWSKSDLMTELNTLYLNSTSGTCYTVRNNATTACNFTNTGLSEEARNLTADALYYLGGLSTYSGIYPNDYYAFERGTTVWGTTSGQTCNDGACPRATTWTGRVGIIYPSDYAYATDLSVCTKDSYNYKSDENCYGKDWLLDTSNYQWTISPYSSNALVAFYVHSAGDVRSYPVDAVQGGRPVQYLRSEVTIVEGEGTSTNPYKLGT